MEACCEEGSSHFADVWSVNLCIFVGNWRIRAILAARMARQPAPSHLPASYANPYITRSTYVAMSSLSYLDDRT